MGKRKPYAVRGGRAGRAGRAGKSGDLQQRLAFDSLEEQSILSEAEEISRAERESELLTTSLKEAGLVRLLIPKDGACLFRATSMHLFHNQDQHLALRRQTCETLRTHGDLFLPFIPEENLPLDNYISILSHSSAWAGQIEMTALAMAKMKFWRTRTGMFSQHSSFLSLAVVFLWCGSILSLELPFSPDTFLPFGSPTFSTDRVFSDGITFTAATVRLPFLGPQNRSLHYLASGFSCPFSDLCPSSLSLPTCRCDFSLLCNSLPECCKTSYPDIWEPLCLDKPGAWHQLIPSKQVEYVSLDIRHPNGIPQYFYYHPSPSSACKGFGFDVLPSVRGWNESFAFAMTMYVSAKYARPELDPNRWVVEFTHNTEMAYDARFCPPSSASRAADSAGIDPQFLSQSNVETIFMSLFSTSSDEDPAHIHPCPVTLQLVETNSVSDGSLISEDTALACDPLIPRRCIADNQTVSGFAPQGNFSYFLYRYEASATACAPVVFAVRTIGPGDANLYLAFPEDSLSPWFYAASYMSRKPGPDSTSFFMCPGDKIMVSVNMYLGSASFLLTATTAATFLSIDVATGISPLYSPSWQVNSARMRCYEATTPSHFTLPGGELDYRCTSWYGRWFDNCRQFFPLGFSETANPLWPPPPPPYGSYDSAQLLNITALADLVPVYNASAYIAAIVLDRVLFNPDGSQTGLTYFSRQQLSSCRFQFLGKIYDPDHQQLLRGMSAPLSLELRECDIQRFSEINDEISSGIQLLSSSQIDPLTQDRRLYLTSLQPGFSTCASHLEPLTYATTVTIGTDPPSNCAVTDPCCPTATPEATNLYDRCMDTSSVQLNTVLPNTTAISDACQDPTCITRLITEAGTTADFLTGEPIEKCVSNANTAAETNVLINSYLVSCRQRFLGPHDAGIPCASVADCPGADSGRVICSPFHRHNYLASWDGHTSHRCLADTDFWDRLIFQCLLSELPPILEEPFRAALHLPAGPPLTDPEVSAVAWDAFASPGCSSEDPSDLFTFSQDYFQWLNNDGDSCVPRDGCPLGMQCLDTRCDLPFLCFSPWRSCSYSWAAVAPPILSQSQCLLQRRCNFYSGADTLTCGNDLDCDAVCKISSSPFFCGYCDPELNGRCYAAEEITSEAQCNQLATACYTPSTGQLSTSSLAPCNGGLCDIPNVNGSYFAASAEECASRSVCTFGPGTRPFQAPVCLHGIEFLWPACNPGITTAAGCAMVDTVSGELLQPEEGCESEPNKYFRAQNRTWIAKIETPQACLDDDRLKICFLQPFPTLFNQSLCELNGGVFRSPFTFLAGNFSSSRTVPLSWIPKQIVSQASFPPAGRLDYRKISTFYRDIVLGIFSVDLQSRAVCRFFSPFATSVTAVSCQCQGTPDADSACLPFNASSNLALPDPTLTGITIICQNHTQTIRAPPALVELSSSFRFTAPSPQLCMPLNVSYYSAGHFFGNRTRIRGTSFFVSRQDQHVPSLAVMNDNGSVIGKMLSDGVRLQSLQPSTLYNVTICISPRQDFVEETLSKPGQEELSRLFSFGIADLDFKRVQPLRGARVSIRFFIPTADSSPFEALPTVRFICNSFSRIETGKQQIFFAITTAESPFSVHAAFSNSQAAWLNATAAVYLAVLCLCLLPTILYTIVNAIRSSSRKTMRITFFSTSFLSVFFILRAVLLFCLAAGDVEVNTTTEFALSGFSTFAEYSSISLVAFYFMSMLVYIQRLKVLPAMHKPTLVTFVCFNLIILFMLVAFLIAYSTAPPDDGISNELVGCLGRTTVGQTFWTTRRILRETYSVTVALFALALGCFVGALAYLIRKQNVSHTLALRSFMNASLSASIALVSQSIVGICLISTGYNSFGFGVAMLWVTEIVPLTMFAIFISWNYIEALKENISAFSFGSAKSDAEFRAGNDNNSSAIPTTSGVSS